MTPLFNFWLSHRSEFLGLLAQHALLVAASTGVAVAIGVPLGVLAAKRPRIGNPLITIANIVQTIPSLAMFGFLIPIPLIGGIGAQTAIFVLILYGLLPVMRTTAAGMTSIDPAVVEAGIAMGMTPRQLLRLVELPLAAPSIVAGIRVATVVGVGTATIAAAIGAGGLGDYIFRGLSMVDPTVILAGAIPAAFLALAADGSLSWLERRLRTRRSHAAAPRRDRTIALTLLLALACGGLGVWVLGRTAPRIRIGSKNFTEQVILGELLAQSIERYTSLPVDRRLNLGGTFICERALAGGEIQAYVEYTGTALTAIFHQAVSRDSAETLDRVKAAYAATGRTMLPPLGFNNTFAILIRGEDARSHRLRTVTDATPLTPDWRAGFGYEFMEREDGYPGLARAYGFRFGTPPRVMDLSLIYRALADKRVDLIAGDATSGLIASLDLFMLEDDRHYFPPYDAVPVVETRALAAHPELGTALGRLAGAVSIADMRAMNLAVDVRHRDVRDVVKEFLDGLGR